MSRRDKRDREAHRAAEDSGPYGVPTMRAPGGCHPPVPTSQAFPWGKVPPKGADEGNAKGLGTLASEQI